MERDLGREVQNSLGILYTGRKLICMQGAQPMYAPVNFWYVPVGDRRAVVYDGSISKCSTNMLYAQYTNSERCIGFTAKPAPN